MGGGSFAPKSLKISPKIGTTRTITVQITPTGRAGQQVAGVLHLVTTPLGIDDSFNTTGEVLATIPYRYTVS